MKIGPKYKIARRLGASVFEKTQTQKFAMRSERKSMNKSRPRANSDYGLGMLEKQKARYSYGVTSKQFSNYVSKATEKRGNSQDLLIKLLEGRFDNIILRAGFAPTRQAARQIASHGHMTINGKKVTIPSYEVRVNDIIAIREGSKNKAIWRTLEDRLKAVKIPSWLSLNFEKREIKVVGIPHANPSELLFNVGTVLEFYSR